ncbi:hypothetical protein ACF0H5_023857 [Mactra antiquata]
MHKQLKLDRGKHNICYSKASNDNDSAIHKDRVQPEGAKGGRRGKKHKNRSMEGLVPRSNSFAGFTRAKMKTVKLTLVIILAYIACWSPFFISQLWWLYDEDAPASSKYTSFPLRSDRKCTIPMRSEGLE